MRVLTYRKTAKTRLHARHAENAKRLKLHVSKGDTVRVMRGDDKGKEGKVLRVFLKTGRVLIEGVNMVKKNQKPNPMKGETGGIVDKTMPIDQSNVMIFNPATGKGDRVGFKILEDSKKVRVFKSNGEQIKA